LSGIFRLLLTTSSNRYHSHSGNAELFDSLRGRHTLRHQDFNLSKDILKLMLSTRRQNAKLVSCVAYGNRFVQVFRAQSGDGPATETVLVNFADRVFLARRRYRLFIKMKIS